VWIVGAVAEPALELAQHARLADAGLAEQRYEVGRALALHPVEDGLERGELLGPAEERRLACRLDTSDGVLRRHCHRLPGSHRRRLALQLERLELLVVDGLARRPHGPLADGDASGPGGALEPGRDVDGVAGDRVVAADGTRQHLAGVHADPQVEVDARGERLVDLPHRVLHAEPGADRPLGVVLVRHRRAEDRHDVVADVLVDGPAVALDLLAEPHERSVDERLHVLGVHPLGDRGVAGQVGEQDGHLAALLGRRLGAHRRQVGGALGERPAALHAEAGLVRSGGVAVGAAAFELHTTRHAETRPDRVVGPARRAAHWPRLHPVPRGRT
jgi:hypothetical protein